MFRAQLRAVDRWGHQAQTASTFTRPVMILHGDSDRMVPVGNADALLTRYPDAQVRTSNNSGHGVAFQYRDVVATIAAQLLQR